MRVTESKNCPLARQLVMLSTELASVETELLTVVMLAVVIDVRSTTRRLRLDCAVLRASVMFELGELMHAFVPESHT